MSSRMRTALALVSALLVSGVAAAVLVGPVDSRGSLDSVDASTSAADNDIAVSVDPVSVLAAGASIGAPQPPALGPVIRPPGKTKGPLDQSTIFPITGS
jgi:hypothetical protein